MTFVWPLALLFALMVPALLTGTWLQRRRRKRSAVKFSSVALIRAAAPTKSMWRRRIPAGLLLTSLLSLTAAAARPQASMKVPLSNTSIIMAMDVSRSMCATDVDPNRLTVAQAAAREFVKSQPKGTKIGIVAFAGFAQVVAEPTTNTDTLLQAIDGFTTSFGTAIGAATLASIDAIAALNPDVAPTDDVSSASVADSPSPPDTTPDTGADTAAGTTADTSPSSSNSRDYAPDIVVLLTDGANTQGVDPVEAAKQAVARKIRVYTIGFGTTNPTSMSCSVEQLGGDAFAGGPGGFGGRNFPRGPGAFGGRRNPLIIDEPKLRAVSSMTGGAFYKAEDASQLKKVFAELPRHVVLQKRHVELSVGFAMFGAALAVVAITLSMWWNRTAS